MQILIFLLAFGAVSVIAKCNNAITCNYCVTKINEGEASCVFLTLTNGTSLCMDKSDFSKYQVRYSYLTGRHCARYMEKKYRANLKGVQLDQKFPKPFLTLPETTEIPLTIHNSTQFIILLNISMETPIPNTKSSSIKMETTTIGNPTTEARIDTTTTSISSTTKASSINMETTTTANPTTEARIDTTTTSISSTTKAPVIKNTRSDENMSILPTQSTSPQIENTTPTPWLSQITVPKLNIYSKIGTNEKLKAGIKFNPEDLFILSQPEIEKVQPFDVKINKIHFDCKDGKFNAEEAFQVSLCNIYTKAQKLIVDKNNSKVLNWLLDNPDFSKMSWQQCVYLKWRKVHCNM